MASRLSSAGSLARPRRGRAALGHVARDTRTGLPWPSLRERPATDKRSPHAPTGRQPNGRCPVATSPLGRRPVYKRRPRGRPDTPSHRQTSRSFLRTPHHPTRRTASGLRAQNINFLFLQSQPALKNYRLNQNNFDCVLDHLNHH